MPKSDFMEDIFESNGFLPLQYIIDSDNKGFDEDHYKTDRSSGNQIIKLRFYKSKKYQTNNLIHVGIWKPASNIHS